MSATNQRIEPDDFDYALFRQHGGRGASKKRRLQCWPY